MLFCSTVEFKSKINWSDWSGRSFLEPDAKRILDQRPPQKGGTWPTMELQKWMLMKRAQIKSLTSDVGNFQKVPKSKSVAYRGAILKWPKNSVRWWCWMFADKHNKILYIGSDQSRPWSKARWIPTGLCFLPLTPQNRLTIIQWTISCSRPLVLRGGALGL